MMTDLYKPQQFTNMDYSRIYINLIERSFERLVSGYVERHHIIPRCMGGDNKPRNIAILTPEEHYTCHLLLAKIYPNNKSLIYAANMMGATRQHNKVYGWLRRKHSEACSGENSPKFGKSPPNKGVPMSEEQKQKLSNIRKGKPSNRRGCKLSPNAKLKISEKNKGKSPRNKGVPMSYEQKQKLSNLNKGNTHSPETRLKISNAGRGRINTPEQIAAQVASRKLNRELNITEKNKPTE